VTTSAIILAPSEAKRLSDLEAIVERGLQSFVAVGCALGEIQKGRLYRATHSTFERYCQARFNFTARRGRQLIAAAQVTAECGTRVPIATERHARVLAPLVRSKGPAAAARVYDAVSEGGPPTVAELHAAVANETTPMTTSPPATIVIPVAQWTELQQQVAKLDEMTSLYASAARQARMELTARAERRQQRGLPRSKRPQDRVETSVEGEVMIAVQCVIALVRAIVGPAMTIEQLEPERQEQVDECDRAPACLLCGGRPLAPEHRWLCLPCVAADRAEEAARAAGVTR
jgi:hypothetical protein